MPAEVLPVGVGRVPAWWMEITPHYVLDEEDEAEKRQQEDCFAFYYMQLAAADDAGFIGPDGRPKLDSTNLKEKTWTPITPWNNSISNKSGASNNLGPGGRNFKPGHPVIDPKLFGIHESDPEYQSYLTGAKLPPGYFEKMALLVKQSSTSNNPDLANNLNQTDYGKYGADKRKFQPSWMKKKLKGTGVGAMIRQGQYDDSPNKFVKGGINRRVEPNDNLPKLSTNEKNEGETETSYKIKNSITTTASANPAASQTIVRTVRQVHKSSDDTDVEALERKAQELRAKQEKLRRLQELQRQQQQQTLLLQQEQYQKQEYQQEQERQAAQRNQQLQQHFHATKTTTTTNFENIGEGYDEEFEEEEIIEEYTDGSVGSYEEEVIDDDDNVELGDLQAILAAKQAELQRLQAQM